MQIDKKCIIKTCIELKYEYISKTIIVFSYKSMEPSQIEINIKNGSKTGIFRNFESLKMVKKI